MVPGIDHASLAVRKHHPKLVVLDNSYFSSSRLSPEYTSKYQMSVFWRIEKKNLSHSIRFLMIKIWTQNLRLERIHLLLLILKYCKSREFILKIAPEKYHTKWILVEVNNFSVFLFRYLWKMHSDDFSQCCYLSRGFGGKKSGISFQSLKENSSFTSTSNWIKQLQNDWIRMTMYKKFLSFLISLLSNPPFWCSLHHKFVWLIIGHNWIHWLIFKVLPVTQILYLWQWGISHKKFFSSKIGQV